MNRRMFFIINPVAGAGRGAAVWRQCEQWLAQPGARPECAWTSRPGAARELARAAAARAEVVVAVGGDGTVSEVADGILSGDAPQAVLAVVPCGTGNDFAETLGISTPAIARQTLVTGCLRRVDVIEVQCRVGGEPLRRHALLFAGVGIAGEALRRTTPRVKRLFGQRLAYFVGLVRALWSYRAPPLRIVVDGVATEKPFLFAGASNTERTGGGMKLAPGALIDDGRLNVNLVEALGRWEAFGQVRRLSQGRHTAHPRVRYSTAQSLSVEVAEPLEVAADGELIGHTPMRCDIRPGALQVLAPPRP